MRRDERERQSDITYDIAWTTLDEGLRVPGHAEACRATSRRLSAPPRCASTKSATTTGRRPPHELERMRALARQAMEDGALGRRIVADLRAGLLRGTDELSRSPSSWPLRRDVHLAHSQRGQRLLEAIDELIDIASAVGAAAEIWHFKASGRPNWPKLDAVDRAGETPRAQRAADHRGHVHVPRLVDGTRRHDAGLGPGGRASRPGSHACATRRCAVDCGTSCRRPGAKARTSFSGPRRSCWSGSATRRCAG